MKSVLSSSFLTLVFLFGWQSLSFGQVVIYEQNFDGNNGTFANGIVSEAGTGGVFANTTAPQNGNYRHVWSVSNQGAVAFAPITDKSIGLGLYNGNSLFYTSTPFRYYDGTNCNFFTPTIRWVSIPISTTGFEDITVEFKWRGVGEVGGTTVYDYGTFMTSINGGANWLMDETGGQGGITSANGTFAGGLYYNNSGVIT